MHWAGQGYEAQGFDRPSDFWKAMEGPQPALVLLDIMLPEEDGLSILQKLRASAATKRLPVIMLTAKGDDMDKIMGLEYGADDYITKPFNILEVKARIKAIIRRTKKKEPEKQPSRVVEKGDLHLEL